MWEADLQAAKLDTAIVGGGVVGLSLAYELACAGESVAVLERGAVGQEASWAGAGILVPGNRQTAVHPLDQLFAYSGELHPQWSLRLREETGIDNGYRRCGGLYLAQTAGEAAMLAGMALQWQEQQIEFARLDSRELLELEPGLAAAVGSGRIQAAYRVPSEAQLRNPWHLQALRAACEQRGVLILAQTEVESFERIGTRLEAACTQRGKVAAAKFCLTAGAWTRALLLGLRQANGIMPVRGQMILLKCPEPVCRHIINQGPRYLVPREDGRLLVGSTEEEVGYQKGTTTETLNGLFELAASVFPQLTRDQIEANWSGLRPASFDGLPYLGRLAQLENAYVAAGHFRSGLHLSCASAVVMRQLLLGEEPIVDLRPFAPHRG